MPIPSIKKKLAQHHLAVHAEPPKGSGVRLAGAGQHGGGKIRKLTGKAMQNFAKAMGIAGTVFMPLLGSESLSVYTSGGMMYLIGKVVEGSGPTRKRKRTRVIVQPLGIIPGKDLITFKPRQRKLHKAQREKLQGLTTKILKEKDFNKMEDFLKLHREAGKVAKELGGDGLFDFFGLVSDVGKEKIIRPIHEMGYRLSQKGQKGQGLFDWFMKMSTEKVMAPAFRVAAEAARQSQKGRGRGKPLSVEEAFDLMVIDDMPGGGFFDFFEDLGSGLVTGFKKIGEGVAAAAKETGRFFEGKTGFKPSQLLTGLSGAALLGATGFPVAAPILAPLSGALLGFSRLAQAAGSGRGKLPPRKSSGFLGDAWTAEMAARSHSAFRDCPKTAEKYGRGFGVTGAELKAARALGDKMERECQAEKRGSGKAKTAAKGLSKVVRGVARGLGAIPLPVLLLLLGTATAGLEDALLQSSVKGSGLYTDLKEAAKGIPSPLPRIPEMRGSRMSGGVKKGQLPGMGVKLAGQGTKLPGQGVKLAGQGLRVRSHAKGAGMTVRDPVVSKARRSRKSTGPPSVAQPEAAQMRGRGKKYGTREEVWSGRAQMTRGGLRKSDLMLSSRGKIISRKKHMLGQGAIKHLRR